MFISTKKKKERKKVQTGKNLSLSLYCLSLCLLCVCTGVFYVFMCECVFDIRRSVTTELIQSMPIFRVWPRYHAADKPPVHRGMMWAESLHWTCTLYHTNTHSHSLLRGYTSLDTVRYVCASRCAFLTVCNSSICILSLSWHFEERKKMIKAINHKNATTLAGPHCKTVQSYIRSVTAGLSEKNRHCFSLKDNAVSSYMAQYNIYFWSSNLIGQGCSSTSQTWTFQTRVCEQWCFLISRLQA